MRQTTKSSGARKRTRRLSEEKRAALTSAAIEELSERGLEAFSLQRVAATAGITRGLVYYYWDDREELLRDVLGSLRELLIEAAQVWGAPAERDTYWRSVERVYERAFRALADRPHHLGLFRRIVEAGPRAPEPVAELVGDARAVLSQALATGQELGAIRDDLPLSLLTEATFALAGASDAWVIQQVSEGADPDQCTAATMALLRSTVAAPHLRGA